MFSDPSTPFDPPGNDSSCLPQENDHSFRQQATGMDELASPESRVWGDRRVLLGPPQEVQQLGPALELTNHYKHPPTATRDSATQEKEDAHMSKILILCRKTQSQQVIKDSHGCPCQNRSSPFTSQKAGPPATVCVCPGNSLSASTPFFDRGRNG